jgi:hypothetical protein
MPIARKNWLLLLKRPEVAIALALFVLLAASLAATKTMRIGAFEGDTALFFQLTENIAERGQPISAVATNIDALHDSGLLIMTPALVAKNPLLAPANSERNILNLHAYYILYPIGLLAKIIPVSPLLMTLYALSFVGLLALVYFALRQNRIPILAAVVFCVIVVSHPAWVDSLMLGQFYPDRLFILCGFLFMYLLSRDDVPRGTLMTVAIVLSLIMERAAITAGMFTVAYVVLYWKRPSLDRYFKLGLGALLLMYGLFIVKVVLVNPAYSSFLPTSLSQVISLFQSPGFAEKTALFLLINGLLLVIAIFEWRAAAIAAFLMLPNIFGTIGGAEKVGWVSHYHSYYFPALVWAAMVGYAAAYKWATSLRIIPAFYAAGIVIALALSSINPFSLAPITMSTGLEL